MRWLRSIVVVVLLAGSGVLAAAAPACACSCSPLEPGEAYANAEVVFVGVAVDVDEPWGGPFVGSGDPVTVTFDVSGVYKGDVPANPQVRTARYGESCGYEFAEGERYLVFAYVGDGGWATGLCSGNEVLTATGLPSPGAIPSAVLRTGAYPPGPAVDRPLEWPLLLLAGLGVVAAVGAIVVVLRRGRRRRASKIGSSGDTGASPAP